MKFVIARQELNNLITKAINVVPQKATIPILSNFLVEASGNELLITATDLTVGVRCFTACKVVEEGATTFPARKFASLIRELTCEHVEISVDSHDVIEIIAGSSRFKLHGMSRAEYPNLPDLTDATQFRMKEKELKEMFFRTSFAVSREDNRYVLTGVFLQVSDRVATFVGTDGKRLAKTHIAVDTDPSFSGDYIVPLKAVEELLKSLNEGEESEATVFLMNGKIAFKGANAMLVTKLLSGDYPDISRVIPESSECQVSLHREELMTLLRQISLFTEDTTRGVRFSFTDGELKLVANTAEVGEGKVSMPVNYQGAPLDVAFNPGFFLDILRHSNEETVKLGLTDPFNPGVITDPGTELEGEASPLFVLMPMRLNDE